MKNNALQAARPKASYDIAREIADMLFLEDDDDDDDVSDQDYDDGNGDVAYEAAMEAGDGVGGGARQVEGWAREGAVGGGGGLEEGAWAAEKSGSIAEGAEMFA